MQRDLAWMVHEHILVRVSDKAALRRLAHDDFLRFHSEIIYTHEVAECNTNHSKNKYNNRANRKTRDTNYIDI